MRHIAEDGITLKNNQDEDVKIKSKIIFTPRKNLAQYKVPDGIQKTQVETAEKNLFHVLTDNLAKQGCLSCRESNIYVQVVLSPTKLKKYKTNGQAHLQYVQKTLSVEGFLVKGCVLLFFEICVEVRNVLSDGTYLGCGNLLGHS